jgi:long-subunit acyl-CoA synthetase (AMP-forming)
MKGYGLTETTARIFATVGPKESEVIGATGKLISNCQAKIVDPDTGVSLPPFSPGELWVRGDTIMKGNRSSSSYIRFSALDVQSTNVKSILS